MSTFNNNLTFLSICLTTLLLLPLSSSSPLSNRPRIFRSKEQYNEAIGDGKTVYVVKYFAPWCGHCKRLAPVWDELSDAVKDQGGLVIASVDCTNKKMKPVCDEEGIRGFPTIKSVFGGESKEMYKGARDLENLKKWAVQQQLLWTAETVV